MLQGSTKTYQNLGKITPASFVAGYFEAVGKKIVESINLAPILEVMKRKIEEWGEQHDKRVAKKSKSEDILCSGTVSYTHLTLPTKA